MHGVWLVISQHDTFSSGVTISLSLSIHSTPHKIRMLPKSARAKISQSPKSNSEIVSRNKMVQKLRGGEGDRQGDEADREGDQEARGGAQDRGRARGRGQL